MFPQSAGAREWTAQRCRDILSAFDASRGFLEIPTRCPSIPPAMLFLLWDQTADGLLAEPYRLVSGKMAPTSTTPYAYVAINLHQKKVCAPPKEPGAPVAPAK